MSNENNEKNKRNLLHITSGDNPDISLYPPPGHAAVKPDSPAARQKSGISSRMVG